MLLCAGAGYSPTTPMTFGDGQVGYRFITQPIAELLPLIMLAFLFNLWGNQVWRCRFIMLGLVLVSLVGLVGTPHTSATVATNGWTVFTTVFNVFSIGFLSISMVYVVDANASYQQNPYGNFPVFSRAEFLLLKSSILSQWELSLLCCYWYAMRASMKILPFHYRCVCLQTQVLAVGTKCFSMSLYWMSSHPLGKDQNGGLMHDAVIFSSNFIWCCCLPLGMSYSKKNNMCCTWIISLLSYILRAALVWERIWMLQTWSLRQQTKQKEMFRQRFFRWYVRGLMLLHCGCFPFSSLLCVIFRVFHEVRVPLNNVYMILQDFNDRVRMY